MLVSEWVEVKVTWQTVDYYKNLGYDIPKGKNSNFSSKIKMLVKDKDLSSKSGNYIKLKCDYCGKDFERRYADHTFIKSKSCIDKDCCEECASIKYKESFLLENGVGHPFQLDSVKDKIKVTSLEKYGVENPSQNEEIYQKVINTSLERYGVNNPSKSEEVKQSIVNTMIDKYGVENIMDLEEYRLKIAETLSKNQSVSTSRQQLYLHKIFGGVLNYSNKTPILDIAFIEEMIYLEYNGGGHTLAVKLGSMTIKEFKNKELKRYHYLKDKGWKAIFIDSDNDLLPSEIILKELLIIAKEYLNSGEKWIKFDIDNSKIILNKNKINYNYGKLRKIKEIDFGKEVS
jgi:hypothetical protein